MKKLLLSLILSMTATSLIQAYSQADLATLNQTGECRSCNLNGISIYQLRLSPGIEITDLSNSTLKNSNLPGIRLIGVQVQNVDFSGANLTNANLSRAYLVGANLTGAKTSGMILTGARTK